MTGGDNNLWVFGYGSLCWHPGFDYGDQVIGHIKGFARKFWQGNTTHRGTDDKPGRVATLVEERHAALNYLNNREVTLGGYVSHITIFYPKDKTKDPFPILLYIATPTNRHWLGPAPLDDVAEQVVASNGNTGHNVEYVLRLADWIRDQIPDVRDDHLFSLEKLIKRKIVDRNLCLATLMGEKPAEPAHIHNEPAAANVAHSDDEDTTSKTKAFTAGINHKKLRCLKV